MNIVLTIIIVGLLLYCINAYVPMEATVKKILNIVVILALVYWLLKVFGLLHYLEHLKL